MEKYIKKILCPVDGSDSSKKALEMALVMAGCARASVIVLEVIEEFGPLPGYYEAAPPGAERIAWVSEQRFEKVHPVLDETNVQWERKIVEGYAAEQICEIAAKESCDLIVIGSRGLNPVARFLVGSVSDRVVHHAPCSVTVVR